MSKGSKSELIESANLKQFIHIVRDEQVMLDRDLANLYQVTTGRLNESVKRNIKRFPERFMFQLTEQEYDFLVSQIAIPKKVDKRGGTRYLPYAFTEQGIAMLSSVLRSDIAISVSINIMDAFVEMRKLLASNRVMFERISNIEFKQIETDKKIEAIFNYIANSEETKQKIFFKGQIYDAFKLLVEIVQMANKSILLIDNYVDINTLNILCKRKDGVIIKILTAGRGQLSTADINRFIEQYKNLSVEKTSDFHDRFLILDDSQVYHIGASLKDAGKKSFAITKLEDERMVSELISRIVEKSEIK